MSVIYVIRHAQSAFGGENYDELTDLGKRQAVLLGKYFNQIGLKLDVIYSGALNRQIHTARIVASEMPEPIDPNKLRIIDSFNEFNYKYIIDAQLKNMMKEDPYYHELVKNMNRDKTSFQEVLSKATLRCCQGTAYIEGQVKLDLFIEKVRSAVLKVDEDNRNVRAIGIFTSGGVLCALMKITLKLSKAEMARLIWEIQNTSFSIFSIKDEQLKLKSFNCLAHLEASENRELISVL